MSLPDIGSAAPDFTLPSTGEGPVTLSSFRGTDHVLLAFFPLAFTGTCTAEVCEFSDDYQAYRSRGAVVLPISVDSVPTLKVFKTQEKLTVDLLSDFKRDVARQYGVLEEEHFFARRAYILIDRTGVVRWTWVEPKLADKRGSTELLAQLDALA